MAGDSYNYTHFNIERDSGPIEGFPDHPVKVGTRAPDFALEDLDSGEPVHLRDLWRDGLLIMEFGSFT